MITKLTWFDIMAKLKFISSKYNIPDDDLEQLARSAHSVGFKAGRMSVAQDLAKMQERITEECE